ncbi:MAG TPA: hypothetical protein VLE73_02100 [Candidatus Saccharimonadales bacterium]|nr:hypothetical protein [Candidatus Saccharimonadales bacterium]
MDFSLGKKRGVDADITALASVLRESGNDVGLLSDALLALEPEQRVAVLGKIVDSLPPLVRGLVWGEVGLTTDAWPDVAAKLTAEERRPFIVQALVDRGAETRALDLTQVPAGTELNVDLYSVRHMVTPVEIARNPASLRFDALAFTALGDGAFMPAEDLSVGDRQILPRGRRMTVGMADAQGAFVQKVAFGYPMVVAGPQHAPEEYATFRQNVGHRVQCNVGRVALDHQQVFTQ